MQRRKYLFALAATALLAATVLTTLYRTNTSSVPSGGTRSSASGVETKTPPSTEFPPPQALRETASGAEDPIAAAATEYAAAKEHLEDVLDENADTVDPEVLEPVKENLGLIETAVMELTLALAQNPEDGSLREALLGMYNQQVKLLQKALHLTSDDNP